MREKDGAKGRYFATAARMDEAFLSLLEEKDFAYVTVKEICRRANVNRSTFYLHYETLDDLLLESVEWMIDRFREHMALDAADVIERIRTCPLSELSFMTPRYLLPYLSYLEKNKRLFLTALRNAKTLELEKSYAGLFRHVLSPVLERFGVPERQRPYLMAFYMHGLMAIVTRWLEDDCRESKEEIMRTMMLCVPNAHTADASNGKEICPDDVRMV